MHTKEIYQSIESNLENTDFDAMLVFGINNIQYATGINLPFAFAQQDRPIVLLWIRSGKSILFIPDLWISGVDGSCGIKDIRTYSNGKGEYELAALIAKALRDFPDIQNLGIDLESISHSLYIILGEETGSIRLSAADDFLRKTRSIKTPKEIELLKTLAMNADHAVNGCLHHITVDRRMSELTLAEELRIHSLERDIEQQGYHACSQVACGEETKEFWPNTPKFGYAKTKDLKDGDTIRVQLQHTKDGYWGVSARMMINNSHLTDNQTEGYSFLNKVHDLIMENLKPGERCCDIFKKISSAVKSRNILLALELGLGHGIGVSSFESPFLSESDTTVLMKDMVLVIDPVINMEDGIYRSKNTVVITESGGIIVGWYKDWREPYTPIMSI